MQNILTFVRCTVHASPRHWNNPLSRKSARRLLKPAKVLGNLVLIHVCRFVVDPASRSISCTASHRPRYAPCITRSVKDRGIQVLYVIRMKTQLAYCVQLARKCIWMRMYLRNDVYWQNTKPAFVITVATVLLLFILGHTSTVTGEKRETNFCAVDIKHMPSSSGNQH